MPEHDLDGSHGMRLGELERAILDALPNAALLRTHEDCLHALDVHAWWIMPMGRGAERVNSLSFFVTATMIQAYQSQTASERAATCVRLTEWTTLTVDFATCADSEVSDCDIRAVVPIRIFTPPFLMPPP